MAADRRHRRRFGGVGMGELQKSEDLGVIPEGFYE